MHEIRLIQNVRSYFTHPECVLGIRMGRFTFFISNKEHELMEVEACGIHFSLIEMEPETERKVIVGREDKGYRKVSPTVSNFLSRHNSYSLV